MPISHRLTVLVGLVVTSLLAALGVAPVAQAQGLSVSLFEDPFVCNGALRQVGLVSGLAPNESVAFSSPQMSGVFSQRSADANGQVSVRWRCNWPATWNITVRGSTSSRSASFTIRGVTQAAANALAVATPTPEPTATPEPAATVEPAAAIQPGDTAEPAVAEQPAVVMPATATPTAVAASQPSPTQSSPTPDVEAALVLAEVESGEPPARLALVRPKPANSLRTWLPWTLGGLGAVFVAIVATLSFQTKERGVVVYSDDKRWISQISS